jgi:hypothetical protein
MLRKKSRQYRGKSRGNNHGKILRQTRMWFAVNFAATFSEVLQIIFRGKSRGKLMNTL